ncbi:MAG: hypothetical protein KA314_24880 [Chloroflexi bacterium]|nr:hypothetical protein [Chloroflexota bacterium]MBP8059083.1 hypothetical protein [Chloroflexota bacterium]
MRKIRVNSCNSWLISLSPLQEIARLLNLIEEEVTKADIPRQQQQSDATRQPAPVPQPNPQGKSGKVEKEEEGHGSEWRVASGEWRVVDSGE